MLNNHSWWSISSFTVIITTHYTQHNIHGFRCHFRGHNFKEFVCVSFELVVGVDLSTVQLVENFHQFCRPYRCLKLISLFRKLSEWFLLLKIHSFYFASGVMLTKMSTIFSFDNSSINHNVSPSLFLPVNLPIFLSQQVSMKCYAVVSVFML